MQNIAVSALTESDAKQDWRDAKHGLGTIFP